MNRVLVGLFLMLVFGLAGAPLCLAQCEPQWLPGQGVTGVFSGSAAVTVWDPDGPGPRPPALVVGGSISVAGGALVSNLAMWDGTAWQSVGGGTDSFVRALTVYNGELIVGGDFITAGGVAVNHIARWDGAQWHPLGDGVNGNVYSLHEHQGTLMVGGDFSTAGGQTANQIARWDGGQWSTLGSGMSGRFSAVWSFLTLPSGDLVAGGRFDTAGGVTVNQIARWDGSEWHPFGAGLSGSVTSQRAVYALAVFDGELVAGGAFTTTDGQPINRIARWDGSAWQPLGSGMTDGASRVQALTVFGGELVAAGSSSVAGGVTTNYIARWNGTAWSGLGSGLDSIGFAMTILPDGALAVGGTFSLAGGVSADGIARWDGSTWSAVGPAIGIGGVGFGIDAFRPFDDGLLAVGSFRSVDGQAANCIARWDGTGWSSFGGGAGGQGYISASALEEYGGELVVGGTFTSFDGSPAVNIARWDGVSWRPLGGGLTLPDGSATSARALAIFDGELVAGGGFMLADGQPVGLVAAWNGSVWRALGQGVSGGPTARINALAEFQGELYAGGSFTTADGQSASNIARWDGVTWKPVGTGVTGTSFPVVYALAVYGNELIVGGTFATAGGQTVNHIAAWDGMTWRALGAGLGRVAGNPFVWSMTILNGDLVIAGGFDSAGGELAANLARWDGSAWRGFGTGLNGVAYGSSVYHGQLVVGGNFSLAGGQVSAYFARWTDGDAPAFAGQPGAQTIDAGQTLVLSTVPAAGRSDVQFQWRLNGQPIADGPGGASPGGGDVSGASGILPSPTTGDPVELTISGVRAVDAGQYDLVLTNACGDVTSDPAAVTVLCRADLNQDGLVDFGDYLEFLNLYDAQDPAVDFNQDGMVDFGDYLEFLNLYDAGC